MNFHGELVDVTFSLSLLVNSSIRLYNDKTIYSLLSVTKKRKCIMWHCDKHMGSGAAMQTADCKRSIISCLFMATHSYRISMYQILNVISHSSYGLVSDGENLSESNPRT